MKYNKASLKANIKKVFLQTQKSSLLFFKLILLLVFVLLVMFLVSGAALAFAVVKELPIVYTNIGFAVLLGLASVCFSWFRTLETNEVELQKQIRQIGETSLLSALLFLVASSIKAGTHLIPYQYPNGRLAKLFDTAFSYLAFFLFSLALFFFITVLFRLADILIRRLRIDP